MLRALCIPLLTLAVLITAVPSYGWSDALKQTGSRLADESATSAGLPYTPSEAVTGIKQVLSLGADSAVDTLGRPGGFSGSRYALPLPDALTGIGGDTSELLSAMNMAAETTAGSSGPLLMDAIQGLTVGDYSALLGGGEDAITRFFETSARDSLRRLLTPVVGSAMEQTGVVDSLTMLMAGKQASGVTGGFDPASFIADRTLDGIFSVMALKEKDIRQSNGAGTTELLEKIF